MYAKCDSIGDPTLAFFEVSERGVIRWSAMIGGLAHHGSLYSTGSPVESYIPPFLGGPGSNLGVAGKGLWPKPSPQKGDLRKKNYAGLIDEAKHYFETMDTFGIKQTQEHYAYMVHLLGRVGKLDAAMELVSNMPFEANPVVWGSLLRASVVHGDLELGRKVSETLLILEPEKSGTRAFY